MNIEHIKWSVEGVSFASLKNAIYSILFVIDELTYCRILPICAVRCRVESAWQDLFEESDCESVN